ncbi:MAG TPA: protein kinase, partial [Myxococcota bacterium]|nr:protein kinase [Myxococcota bacterium]
VLPRLTAALAHAHARGVRHRDVKPGNVILTTDGEPVLVDFGIARLDDVTELTVRDAFIGTPAYMSPEMFDDGDVDLVSADTYALGVVLWESLTGRRAFTTERGLTAKQRMIKVAQLKWQSGPLDPGEDVPAAVRELVQAMTSPDPKQRPTDLVAVAARMEAALRGEDWRVEAPQDEHSATLAPVTMQPPDDPGDPSLRSTGDSTTVDRGEVEREVTRWVIGAVVAAIVLGGLGAAGAAWWVGLL